jgi:hypothetical protein
MATKDASSLKKRKAAPSGKGKPDGNIKKPRMEVAKARPAPPAEPENDFESFSDSEDGGAQLHDGDSHQPSRASNGAENGKTFERGMW